jgi:hypothetical protein
MLRKNESADLARVPDVLSFSVVSSKREPGALVRLSDRFYLVWRDHTRVSSAVAGTIGVTTQDNVLVLDTSSFICSGVPLNLRKRL